MTSLNDFDNKEVVKSMRKARAEDIVPLLVVISCIFAAVTSHYFTPWYSRLWLAIQRIIKRMIKQINIGQ